MRSTPTPRSGSVAFIGVATLSTMANAGGASAVRIAELTVGNAAQRAGVQLGLALQMMGESGSVADARNLIRQGYVREEEAVRSAARLALAADSAAKIEAIARIFAESGEKADLARLDHYTSAMGLSLSSQNMSADEQKATHLIPVRKKVAAGGFGGVVAAVARPRAVLRWIRGTLRASSTIPWK